MKNKIDELFKSKTANGQFSYNESHWADAEKLLAKKPRGAFFSPVVIGVVAFLVFSSVLTVAYFSSNQNSTSEFAVEPQTTLPKSTKNNFSEPTKENSIANETSTSPTIIDANTGDLTKPKAVEDNIQQNENGAPTVKNVGNTARAETEKSTSNKTTPTKTIAASAKQKERIEEEKQYAAPNQTVSSISVSSISAAAAASLTAVDNLAEVVGHSSFKKEVVQAPSIDPSIKPFTPSENFVFNVGAEYGYFWLNRQLSAPSPDYQNFRNNYENAKNSSTLGINFQVGYRNWLFNTGVYQLKINENVAYPNSLNVPVGTDNSYWNVYENWTYTTNQSWVIDSINVGHVSYDTTWALNYDSTFVSQWDSSLVEKEDPELLPNNGLRTLSYIEIPLWFGRSFGNNRFAIDVQGGFAVGFLTQVNGSRYINYSLSALTESDAQKEQVQKVLFSAMLRTGIRVEIMPRWEASFYPSLRYTLNSVQNSDAIKQRYFSYGINLGLSYRF